MSQEHDLEKLLVTLRKALSAPPEQMKRLVGDAIQQTEHLKASMKKAAVGRGRKGGKKTAERGPEYFKQIAAMRKKHAGGRPKKADR
ncbi:MAG TPA: hypothetical protein VK419_13015 [Bryobacteraceae bacterium]|nr:hypothetical protein [Bryobacteraceae bacterium]